MIKSKTSTTSSENLFEEYEQTSSSLSSELNLSLVLQSSSNCNSSLSLTTLDNQTDLITDVEESRSETPEQILSDNESVLYLRLSNELNMIEAALDSDLDRIGQ